MSALDAIGPYEVLRCVPGVQVRFVARKAGLVRADSGLQMLNAEYGIDEVKNADILGGYYDGFAVNRTAQIGAVKVKGDWIESNLVAGVQNATNSPGNFGDNLDVLITPTGPNPAILAKIASITIGGQVVGSATGHFGFVAQQIGSFKAAGFTAKLTAGTDAPIQLAVAQGGNVTIHEI